MRIERVVASTFNDASERCRRLYGPDVLLVSSTRVGNAHELLVCTDASVDDAGPTVDPASQATFTAAMHEEMALRPARQGSMPSDLPVAPAMQVSADSGDGQALVSLIRKELQALEIRLASGNGKMHGLSQKMALLEHGVSATYAGRLIEAGLNAVAMADRLLEDLNSISERPAFGDRTAVLVGPVAGGKTTAAMQATLSIAGDRAVPPVVSASRDPRPGAREKFFAMADAARIESSWGGVASGALVVDAGGYGLDDLMADRPELSDYDLYLCIPAFLNRSTAARWLDGVRPLAGVILTHWSPTEVPLGLLGCMAERGVRLTGLSTSQDPAAPLIRPSVGTLGGPVRDALGLALDVAYSGVG